MIDTILLLGISAFFLYAFYDQFVMDKLYGTSLLKVRLKKRAKIDGVIFIGLLLILIYQSLENLSAFSFYLLASIIVLTIYGAFIRSPVLILKKTGFFYGNIFIPYSKIQGINISEEHFLVIDLHSGKRLVALLQQPQQLRSILTILVQLNIIQADILNQLEHNL